MRYAAHFTPSFVKHLSEPRGNAFQKAVYVALKFGASNTDLERDFGVKDGIARITRLQLAKWYGWTLEQIDDLSLGDLQDAYDYMAIHHKVEAEQTARAQAARGIKVISGG